MWPRSIPGIISFINHEGKKKEETSPLETEFDAEGFDKGCDPNQKPKFDITKGDALAGEGSGKKPKAKASASASAG